MGYVTSFGECALVWRKQIREQGVNASVRETTAWRLGTALPPKAIEWWVELMSHTSQATLEAFLQVVPTVDVSAELPQIKCPAIVLTATGSGLGSVESVRAWQQTIPDSTLEVVRGDSYHLVATDPYHCAQVVRQFFDRVVG